MDELTTVRAAIEAIESRRAGLGDAVADAALVPLLERQRSLVEATQERESGAGGRRALVTVLFADVSGFTALAERLEPDHVQEILAKIWERLDAVVLRSHGTIDKHIGDAVMAVWGLPLPQEDDAERAVRAALGLQVELGLVRTELGVNVDMRVGLNTGTASVSTVISTGEQNLIGDVVNLASRLEHAAPAGRVLVGPSTAALVRHRFVLEAVQPLVVKGKQEPVAAQLVVRARPRTLHVRVRSGIGTEARTVGRATELGMLLRALETARDGQAQAITVVGEAGVGKTRILLEAAALAEQTERVTLLQARSTSESRVTPYYLLRRLLSGRANISESDDPYAARCKLTDEFCRVLPDRHGIEAAAFVGQLVGIDFRESPLVSGIAGQPAQVLGRARVLLGEYIDKLCSDGGVVMLLDDLHDADVESVELLAELLSSPRGLLVCAGARPHVFERFDVWIDGRTSPGGSRFVTLELAPLEVHHAEKLVRQLLSKAANVPRWIVELILRKTGGNPYFSEVLVRWLVDTQVIMTAGDSWAVSPTPPADLEVPDALQAIVQASVEALSKPLRAILEAASVLGRVFWVRGVEAMLDRSVTETEWLALMERGMVAEQPGSELDRQRQLRFGHGILRDTVYAFVDRRRRTAYHARAADWLKDIAGDQPNSLLSAIARHLEQGGRELQAARYYARAGKLAIDGHAPKAAVAVFRMALRLSADASGERRLALAIHRGLGEALKQDAQHTAACQAYSAMADCARLIPDAGAQAQAENGISWVEAQAGRLDAAARAAQRAIDVASSGQMLASLDHARDELAVELAEAHHNRAWALYLLGDVDAATIHAQDGLDVARGVHAKRQQALCLNVLGLAAFFLQRRASEGNRYLEKALVLYREIEDRWGVACMLNNLGETARAMRRFSASERYYQEALTIARSISDRSLELTLRCNMGASYIYLEEYELARRHLEWVLDATERGSEAAGAQAEANAFLARAWLGLQEFDNALIVAGQALETAQVSETASARALAWRTLAVVLGAHSNFQPATSQDVLPDSIRAPIQGSQMGPEGCFAASLRATFEAKDVAQRAETLWEWARYEAARRQPDRASELYEQAQRLFAEMGVEAPALG